MNKDLYLGIDTSCYTTSIAVVDSSRQLIFDKRIVLNVDKGKKGLRQSEALFQHIQNLPMLFQEMSSMIEPEKIVGVAVSISPRNLEGSYMPVFIAGTSFGKSISSVIKANFHGFSHQEGHIEAAKWSSDRALKDPFLTVHISGGTTEILRVDRTKERYKCSILGGTKDISAGQLIDRVGIMLGLNFPAGRELDKLSEDGQAGLVTMPVSVKDGFINYSGLENYVKKLIELKEFKHTDIAIGLFETITESLYRTIKYCCYKENIFDVLLVGGVASNSYIRHNLAERLKSKGIVLHFGKEEYSTDNAVGTALLAVEQKFY